MTSRPLADARAATASALVDEMRQQAFNTALRAALDDPSRALGQQWLAVHLRLAGVTSGAEAAHRCQCGGFLGTVTPAGDVAHRDACYRFGAGLPQHDGPQAARHRFCADPLVVGIANGCGLWRDDCCWNSCWPS